MADIYVRRNSVVSVEPFDPDRTDQGVTVNMDDDGNILSRILTSGGRSFNVRADDMIVTEAHGSWPCSASSLAGLYQLLSDVVTPDAASIAATGGNQ